MYEIEEIICNDSEYGNYRTRKFTDIWGSYQEFLEDANQSQIPLKISQESQQTLFYLLYSKYGNSHIANADENQFKYKVYSTIFTYGPAWEKRVEIQDKLRTLTEDDIRLGSKQILNHSYNPSTRPSTSTLEELTTINEQNTNTNKKGVLDAYAYLWDLLATDVTTEFINKFKDLFLIVVEPQEPLWYVTDLKEE